MAWTKWQEALTFITNLKEILQNRMTDSLMFLKDIQTKSDDLLTDFLRDIQRKKKQTLRNVNHDRL